MRIGRVIAAVIALVVFALLVWVTWATAVLVWMRGVLRGSDSGEACQDRNGK